jgi:hypothetical protein
LAEKSEAITTPWSFNSLMHLVERGQFQRFDDLHEDEDKPQFRERKDRSTRVASRAASRGRSRSKPAVRTAQEIEKTQTKVDKDGQPRKAAATKSKLGEAGQPPEKSRKVGEAAPSGMAPPGASSSSSHGSPLDQHPPFQAAQRRADAREKPLMEKTMTELLEDEGVFHVERGEQTAMVFSVEIPLPENKRDVKRFAKDSQSWVNGRMKDKKGVELKWSEIPKHRIPDFQQAKAKELSNWLKQSAVRLAGQHVPRERTLRMRWVFNIKQDGSAKARLVIVGFEDPDLTTLRRSSPVMTRRTRGLFLTMCSFKNWNALKGDVRAAFLQGESSEVDREIFARLVKELSEALGGDDQSYVQILSNFEGLLRIGERSFPVACFSFQDDVGSWV